MTDQPAARRARAHPPVRTSLPRRLPRRHAAWLLAALVALVAVPGTSARGPSTADEPVELTDDLLPLPVSDAERRGAEIVLAYLEAGPAAVWDALDADAPLRALGRERGLAEIETRMGPPRGSTWTLRTPGRAAQARDGLAIFGVELASGLDDTLRFELVQRDEAWHLRDLRCAVDPRQPEPTLDLGDLARAPAGLEGAVGASSPTAASAPAPAPASLLWIALFAAVPLLLSPSRARRAGALVLVFSAGVLASCDAISDLSELSGGDDAEVAEAEKSPPLLGRLLPLRRALAGGDDTRIRGTAELDALVAESTQGLAPGDPVALAARAWQAQALLGDGHLDEVEELLASLPAPGRMPAVALLRARLAVAHGDAAATEEHFEDLRRLATSHDGLLMECARAFALVGADIPLEMDLDRLLRSRSREAWPVYAAAKLALIDGETSRAEELFHAAWIRRPIPRRQLFAEGLLAHLATRPRVFPLFRFGDYAEPAVGPRGDAGGEPLSLSADARASVLGEHLVVEVASAALEIPGAGALVPPSAVVQSAAERAADDARRAFGDLATLVAEVESRGLADPARRHRASMAAESLLSEGRWEDVLELTASLSGAPENAPADLVQARATALLRLERSAEATNLLIRVARSDLEKGRRDPTTFYQIGEMLASLGQYELALKALDRAQSLTRLDVTRQRKAQIRLDKELAEASRSYESEHFRLVYPASTGEVYPRRLSWVLEAEWDRLKRWIPVGRLDQKVEVHLYPLMRFLRAYSSDVLVLGIFDGKLRVPLADLASFHPELVRIVSHELAHAMIDVATGGNSPRWLHEGLASHVEMRQRGVNPIPDLHAAGRDLSFSLIEPILDGFGEPQLVDLAYSHATWALHYLEAEHGVRSIHRLLDAFERGHATAEALRRTVGMGPEDFDGAVRRWSLEEAPQVWPSKLVKYHQLFDDLIDREDLGMTVVDPSRVETEEAYNAPSRAQLPARMQEWHRVYTAEVRPVKASLGRAMPLIRGQAEGDVLAACADLERRLRSLLRDGKALACPDPEAARQLSGAYRAFYKVSKECQSRKWNRMRGELQAAMNALGRANEALKPHGLAP